MNRIKSATVISDLLGQVSKQSRTCACTFFCSAVSDEVRERFMSRVEQYMEYREVQYLTKLDR